MPIDKKNEKLETTIKELFNDIRQFGYDDAMYGSLCPEDIRSHERTRPARRKKLFERLRKLAVEPADT